MAEEGAAEADKKPAAAPAFPMKILLMVVAAALVAGIGGAFVIVKFMGGHSNGGGEAVADEPKAEAAPKAEGHGEAAVKQTGAVSPGVMFDLEPFIVNLADAPDIRYLKMTIKLEVENDGVSTNLTARIPQVRDTVLVLLSSKESSAIRSAQGKFQLRDEITQRVNGLLPKPGVKTVYFTEFVVQ